VIKGLIVVAMVLLLLPGASGHTEPPDKGAWTIDDETIIENRTITLTGNIRINGSGSLTLINSTIFFNSPHGEPYGVIVNEGGTLMARDADGLAETEYDRTVFSATVPSSRMRFYAKPGSTVHLRGVEFDHIGTRVIGATKPNTYLGVYCDGADIDISDVHISNTYWGLILNGTSSAKIDGLNGTDLDFTLLQMFDSGDIDVWNLSATDHTGEPAVIVEDCNGTVSIHSPDIDSAGECIKIVSSNNVWIYNATLNSSATLFWVERSRTTIVNLAPVSSEMTVLVDSWVNVTFMIRVEVLRGLEDLDPVEGAVVNITSCDSRNYQCDRVSTLTGADGLTPIIMVPIAYFNESSTVHEAEHIITILTKKWNYTSVFRPDDPGVVSFLEFEGVPYDLIPMNGPEVNGLVRKATNLTVSVIDLLGQPAITGEVSFVILGSYDDHGLSFSQEKPPRLSMIVPVVNGFATVSLYSSKEVENEEITVVAEKRATSFYVTTILLFPVMSFDAEVQTGSRVTFDASGSEGTGLTYLIEFGDGTNSGWMEGPAVDHVYNNPGTYTVRLQVKNEDGLTQGSEGRIRITDEEAEQPDLLVVVGGSVLILGLLTLTMAAMNYRRRKRAPAREADTEEVRPTDKARMAIKWYDRGTRLATENIDEAASCLEKALQLNPTLSRAHYNLGLLLVAKGDLAGSREMFVHALSNDPGMTDAKKALDALERRRRVIVKK